jgi:hypothetical protein
MSVFLVLLLIAFILGIFFWITYESITVKNKNWIKKFRTGILISLTIASIVIVLYSLTNNIDNLSNPPPFLNLSELQFFLINHNIYIITLIFFLALLAFTTFLIKIQFVNWKHVKMFGIFEGERFDELKDEAVEVMALFRDLEHNKLNFLTHLNLGFYLRLTQIVKEHGFDKVVILQTLAENIEKVYDIPAVHYRVRKELIHIEQNNRDELEREISHLSEIHKKSIVDSFESKRVCYGSDNKKSVIIMPYFLNDNEITTSFLYLESKEYQFDDHDKAFFQSVFNILQMYSLAALMDYEIWEQSAEEGERAQ